MSAFFVSIVSTFFLLPLPVALGRGGTTRGGTTRGGTTRGCITLAGGGTPGIKVCLDVVCFGTNSLGGGGGGTIVCLDVVSGGTIVCLAVVCFGTNSGRLGGPDGFWCGM